MQRSLDGRMKAARSRTKTRGNSKLTRRVTARWTQTQWMPSTARRRDAGLSATLTGRRHASSHGPGVQRLSCP